MRIFEPHIHMTSRTTDDYRGHVRRQASAPWSNRPSGSASPAPLPPPSATTSTPSWAAETLPRRPVRHRPPLHDRPQPQGGQRPPVPARPRRPAPLSRSRTGWWRSVEIGYDSMTPAKNIALATQLQLAGQTTGCPPSSHTPHRDKLASACAAPWTRSVRLPHCPRTGCWSTTSTRPPVKEAKDSGAWLGFSVYPDTKMDDARMVALLREPARTQVLVNSRPPTGERATRYSRTRKLGDDLMARTKGRVTDDRRGPGAAPGRRLPRRLLPTARDRLELDVEVQRGHAREANSLSCAGIAMRSLDDDRRRRLRAARRDPPANPATTRSSYYMDPLDPYVKVEAARRALAGKKLGGLRYRMAVIYLDPSPIRGGPRPPPRERRRRSAPHLLHPPRCRRPGRGHRRETTPAPAGRTRLTHHPGAPADIRLLRVKHTALTTARPSRIGAGHDPRRQAPVASFHRPVPLQRRHRPGRPTPRTRACAAPLA
ncbi:hypothetical protein SVIOM342S_01357 [Streptomyces violaceorubidus]